jgi:hypothetical protein
MCAPYHFARLTPFWDGLRKPAGSDFRWLEVDPPQQAEADEADENQVDGNDEIEKPRHDQDQNACNQGHEGRHVRSGDNH